MMAQSSGYFTTVRTKMNFHWFEVSFVKNLLCECGTQTHRHTYACTRAKKLWANERTQREGVNWLIFWSPAVFVMYRLALVVDKTKATVFGARFDRQSQQIQYIDTPHALNLADSFIWLHPCARVSCVCLSKRATNESLLVMWMSVQRFIDTLSFGCAYAMDYTRTQIISILITMECFIIETLHSRVYRVGRTPHAYS